MKIALFPGSFDPITKGHFDIITKGLRIFDKIVVAIGHNTNKKSLFSVEERKKWIEDLFINEPRVEIVAYTGLTIEFCKKVNANFILRGLRTSVDFDYEQSIAYANKELVSTIETVFLLSSPAYFNISSTIVRDIIVNGGEYQKFVPDTVVINLE
ncbi:MAG: pantetheine-phosphate adenylyltransferase [Bacteroidota bacterium]|nr:pantetheine-phosphate adenylyltransferase [Bacteroidota bacterium]